VMLARSGLEPGTTRYVDAVQIGTVDLVPIIVAQLLRAVASDDPDAAVPAAGAETAQRVECLIIETGHLATATATAKGVLVGYAGLLRLTSLEASK